MNRNQAHIIAPTGANVAYEAGNPLAMARRGYQDAINGNTVFGRQFSGMGGGFFNYNAGKMTKNRQAILQHVSRGQLHDPTQDAFHGWKNPTGGPFHQYMYGNKPGATPNAKFASYGNYYNQRDAKYAPMQAITPQLQMGANGQVQSAGGVVNHTGYMATPDKATDSMMTGRQIINGPNLPDVNELADLATQYQNMLNEQQQANMPGQSGDQPRHFTDPVGPGYQPPVLNPPNHVDPVRQPQPVVPPTPPTPATTPVRQVTGTTSGTTATTGNVINRTQKPAAALPVTPVRRPVARPTKPHPFVKPPVKRPKAR